MSRLPLAPTRGNLIILKEEMSLAVEAHELLERKRDVLVNELMRYADRLREVEREFHGKFTGGLRLLCEARVRMGRARMRRAMTFPLEGNEFSVLDRSVMGVHVIELSITKQARQPMPGPAESVPELDAADENLREALSVLGEYVTRMGSVWRLATEVRKTQRRLNALEDVFIPEYRETSRYIQGALEQDEREEFFRQKRVKGKLARRGRLSNRRVSPGGAEGRGMITKILYVVTTTEEALRGAAFVADLALAADAQIIAFSVIDTAAAQRLVQATGQSEAEIVVKFEEDAWRYLYDVEDTCKNLGAKIVLQQDEGFPDAKIAAAAKQFNADVVVLARSGRVGHAHSRRERSIMSLIERLECPVLVV